MIGSSSRMLSLLSLLQTQRRWPGHVLADRLAVTPRTVRRDVDRLRELGYQISSVKGPDGGYRLAAGSELPPLLFDDEQAVAIAVALQSVPTGGVDIDEAAARALATVRQVMPSRLRHRIDGIRFTGAETPSRVDPAVLEAVSTAVRDQLTLRFDYIDQKEAPRRLEPHAIVARANRWYLIGWDLDKADWRFFRLDRMTPRTPAGSRFTPRTLPAPDAQSFLAARSKGSETEDRWPCAGQVLIELPAIDVAPWIGDGELEVVTDSSTLMTIGSWSWAGLLAFVTRFDAPFTVIGPEPLRRAAGTLADRFRASQDQPGDALRKKVSS
ncbi:helix-turn-helix transcriptional regulator [Pengzhenrongella frigida]|uniref:WYL domain-containing transcriptional regulator n=1 Tax=Pengzhenrongella frigida TaxID=1259133 RepID=A0A4Q5N357_9MICO|nr:WYL domain-containing protein [Cellulomonas sp. HLT2-17]RYV52610.1 WYL domain-containing transcriptional regulator [Cellulomonas sp. HLT2-17]